MDDHENGSWMLIKIFILEREYKEYLLQGTECLALSSLVDMEFLILLISFDVQDTDFVGKRTGSYALTLCPLSFS
ncbi:hypothetical protein CHS0354_032796 [Potamilus streckersoni]|uniref:Uncharacterized protein n=1 Tax=Potamilus streckersoni TaxID=2493646 RepID=A0AAE0VSP3_9BIVA|nr:hypothetical protein CHS0354_032796 [Potamilus streckersoni]